MKNHKKTKIMFFIGLFFLLIIILAPSYAKIKFMLLSGLPLSSECNELFINSEEKRQAKKYIGKKVVYDAKSLEGGKSNTRHTNEIFSYNGITYIDLIVKEKNSNYREIIKYDKGVYTKFIANNQEFVIANINNDIVKKVEMDFEELNYCPNGDANYIDPFIKSEVAFVTKNRKEGFSDYVVTPEQNKTMIASVYETVDNPIIQDAKFDFFTQDTDVIIIAIKYKVAMSTIMDWYLMDELAPEGVLKKSTLLCKEKTINFRYGREVVFSNPDEECKDSIHQVSDWDTGISEMKLQQPFEFNNRHDCIFYNIIKHPYGMDLCDQFFVDKAKNAFCANLSSIYNTCV